MTNAASDVALDAVPCVETNAVPCVETNAVPCVTIILPTYNSTHTLKYAIASALAQDFTDFELWVVGDGCTDDTESVVAAFVDSRILWHNLPSNSGNPATPINYALMQAKGKFTAWLSHDDLWFPWHLSSLLQGLEQTDVDFVNGLWVAVDKQGFVTLDGLMPRGRNASNRGSAMSTLFQRTNRHLWDPAPSPNLGVDTAYWFSQVKAKLRFATVHRLTALSFPSHLWQNYSPSRTAQVHQNGQEQYWQKMQASPEKLEQELIFAAALAHARTNGELPPVHEIVIQACRKLLLKLIFWYGWEKPPLKQLLAWWLSVQRKKNRLVRGLSAKEAALYNSKSDQGFGSRE